MSWYNACMNPTPKMSDEDLRQHLVNHHGLTEHSIAMSTDYRLREYHRNMHTDETAKHLPHTHVADWDGPIQFL